MNGMLYPELYRSLESVRWDMEKDIPWDKFDASMLSPLGLIFLAYAVLWLIGVVIATAVIRWTRR